MSELQTNEYKSFLVEVKQAIQQAQVRAMVTVNQELLQLYWSLGDMILERQKKSNWGDKIIQKLANDIKEEYPSMKGFSYRNLKYMRTFAREYRDFQIGQTPSAQITWSHNTTVTQNLHKLTHYATLQFTSCFTVSASRCKIGI